CVRDAYGSGLDSW
nr:immunoglobulin heavy chain junction region [Macaca mulatta]MOV87188.1 immunoglobulin heavy chain junction region [Macaca mulatta]MOV87297.1 immunoglobulin heavy chain junction region [Macaca mulatta]MOV87536.1 immunoglobulin heavy chain junction region [Macaca mulatta]MOV87730.1 immunoglobulin heavy chain junction region [Macaca mulatta]